MDTSDSLTKHHIIIERELELVLDRISTSNIDLSVDLNATPSSLASESSNSLQRCNAQVHELHLVYRSRDCHRPSHQSYKWMSGGDISPPIGIPCLTRMDQFRMSSRVKTHICEGAQVWLHNQQTQTSRRKMTRSWFKHSSMLRRTLKHYRPQGYGTGIGAFPSLPKHHRRHKGNIQN